MTAPTIGFGEVWPTARRARRSASCMKSESVGTTAGRVRAAAGLPKRESVRFRRNGPCRRRFPALESGVMPKKKRVARPRVLWQVNPTTQVVHSARRYERTTEKKEIRKTAEDEQER